MNGKHSAVWFCKKNVQFLSSQLVSPLIKFWKQMQQMHKIICVGKSYDYYYLIEMCDDNRFMTSREK